MFERFTEEARRVVVIAQEEAREARAERISAAHLLLGVALVSGPGERALRAAGIEAPRLREAVREVGDDDGLDAAALAALGIDLAQVREQAEAAFGPGALAAPRSKRGRSGHMPFSDRAKRALEQALRAALRRGDRSIGTEHVLLGTLAVGDAGVTAVLHRLAVAPEDLRRRLDSPDAA